MGYRACFLGNCLQIRSRAEKDGKGKVAEAEGIVTTA